jgi:hypothetical protein
MEYMVACITVCRVMGFERELIVFLGVHAELMGHAPLPASAASRPPPADGRNTIADGATTS